MPSKQDTLQRILSYHLNICTYHLNWAQYLLEEQINDKALISKFKVATESILDIVCHINDNLN